MDSGIFEGALDASAAAPIGSAGVCSLCLETMGVPPGLSTFASVLLAGLVVLSRDAFRVWQARKAAAAAELALAQHKTDQEPPNE